MIGCDFLHVERLEASTVIHLPPEKVYEALVDFTQYANYADYVTEIRRHGAGEMTEYDIDFSWWKLSYTARSAVTDVDPPNRIDWELTKDLDAHGHWTIEQTQAEEMDEIAAASRVTFDVEYDPNSLEPGAISLPALVPLEKAIDLVVPKIEAEAKRIIRRLVVDLEGEERPVEITVTTT